ncbi:MAG: hypothetical protein A2X03_16030 [Bacteroidetes bacterium GWA2_40_15]|nr:MAG: hypothetical protein A2X03_16030 [Bacteroidetes bacterium GWA2_40_15]OFX94045.1 MAG: hypothetical protein A2X06_14940 [Bacteroidetes bacterium GWC2_40_22]HBH82190.1 hypothetical protein [Bacteroidales bacterium]HBQ82557.1 hypothetical protein [Bacteroidales bacterium]
MKTNNHNPGRREFISKLSMVAALGAIGSSGIKGALSAEKYTDILQTGSVMPTIRLGPHNISRLIVGSNPMLGYSYMGPHTDRQMKDYFTTERTAEFLLQCEQAGITAHQSSSRFDYMNMLREQGSKLKIFTLQSDRKDISSAIENAGPIGLAHHGGVTDRLFAEGKSEVVHDYVKAVKDKGILAGVSAHNPDVIKQIADKGWEVDFFMTCFYYLTRKMDKPESLPTLPVGSYHFFKDDPEVMTNVIRQVKQPCLAFKILGAGRHTSSQNEVMAAFKFAFDNIKPTDGIIVGMFPWFFDEVTADSRYAIEYGKIN